MDEPRVFAVRDVARGLANHVAKLDAVWVEGQITELSRRPGASTVFMTLRDTAADCSLPVTMSRAQYDALDSPPSDGGRVVVHAKPDFFLARGRLTLAVIELRTVGIGTLLARVEELKARLRAEGLFAPDRKRPLPFLPRVVGLVCGRESAARRDVVENASRRWPAVRFEVREVVVQGPSAVSAVTEALLSLDRHPEVDVIVVARGGGSVEDLLPFSDETLCRAVAECRTPVVSAIGHEQDTPLLDFVADRRASTPTDAGKMVVPDVGEERALVARLRRSAIRCVERRVESETSLLRSLRSRPVLAAPHAALDARAAEVRAYRARGASLLADRVGRHERDVAAARSKLLALSPAATLTRGYSIVHDAAGAIVRDAASVAPGDALRVRLASGELDVTVAASTARRAGP